MLCRLFALHYSALLAFAAFAPLQAATLSADTSRPNMSLFAAGEKVAITFHVTGLEPSSATTLDVVVKDEHDVVMSKAQVAVTAAADGTWSGDYAPPCDRLGFYRVFPTLADGTTLPKLFTRQAGYLTYAIVPDPATRVDYGEMDSFFGVQGGFNKRVNIIPYLGARWVLGGYGWDRLEKDHPGQLVEEVAAARAKGMVYPAKSDAVEDLSYGCKPYTTYVLPSLNGVPNWASDPALRCNQAPILPSAEQAYQSFCGKAVNAFSSNYPGYEEDFFQVTWEPVYPWGYKGTDKQLARIYELAYPAIHKADPKAVVLGPTDGGIGGEDPAWTDRLFKAGLGKYLDGLSIHPYFQLPPERNGLLKAIQDLKDVCRKDLGHELPLYGTEQGYATKEDVSKELLQAQGLVRENLIMKGEGFRLNLAFYIADYSGEPGFGFNYNLHPGCDFGTDKIGPKPVVPAYAAMTYLVDGHKPTERIDWLSPTTLGYAFDRDGDVVLALWDFGDKPRDTAIPVGVDKVTVYDMMGNGRTVFSPNGSLSIALTGDPVYIKGVSPTLWGVHAVKPVSVASPLIDTFPGAPVFVVARLKAASSALTGTLSLMLDKRLNAEPVRKAISLAKGTSEDIKFDTRIPQDAETGSYAATLILKDNAGRTLAGAGTRIEVASPVSVDAVAPITSGNECRLRVILTDAEPTALSGTIVTRLDGVPGSKQTAPFSLSPHASGTLTLDVLDADISPAKVYRAIVRVQTASGYEFEKSFPVDFLQAPKLDKPLTIDANLDALAGVPGVALAGQGSVVRAAQFWKGDADLSAVVKYAWDEQALYLAVDVKKEVAYQANTGFGTWDGDCIQLGIDIDSGKLIVASGNQVADNAASHRWSEFTLALTKNGPEVYRTGSYDMTRFPVAQVALTDIPLAALRDDTAKHTYYETAIPWRMLGKNDPPKLGDRIGVALSVNGMDGPKQTEPMAVGLFGGMNGHKQMDDYGVLTLGDTK